MFLNTYMMSGVYGLKDRYSTMLEVLALQNEDTLFVLGDTINRGRNGIAILLDIMNRDNVYMLLGNHEYMMKQYYEAVHHIMTDMQEAQVVTDHWQHSHCSPTIDAFECLNERKQREPLNYPDELLIVICDLKVYEELSYLTHGSVRPQFTHGIVTRQDAKGNDVTMERSARDRMDVHECLFDDRSAVIGHTPILFFQEIHPCVIWADTGDVKTARIMSVGCGRATNDIHSRSEVVCLDIRTVQYS